MTTFVTYFTPLGWAYLLLLRLPIALLCFLFKLPLTILRRIRKEWDRFEHPVAKVLWTGQFAWWAMPATIPLTFYAVLPYLQWVADAAGYGEEFGIFVTIIEAVASALMTALEVGWSMFKFALDFAIG